jgi:hypothetical protein
VSDGDVDRWLQLAQPVAPQTCVECGRVSLRGFVFCGWCGVPMRDDTRVIEVPTVPLPPQLAEPAVPEVRPAGLGYAAEPVDFAASEKITLVHWPADGEPIHEITNPSSPIRVGGPEVPAAPDDTRPRAASAEGKQGLQVVVLGSGDVQMLAAGDELDVITHESGTTTSFHVEAGGLRVSEIGSPRSVCRLVSAPALLESGAELRIGQTWLAYAREEGREAWGIRGRVYVLAPSGHVITNYDVGEAGLVLGSAFGDPTLAFDAQVAPRQCRIVAGPAGATLEPIEGSTFIAVTEGELLAIGSIACFADIAVRLDPLP